MLTPTFATRTVKSFREPIQEIQLKMDSTRWKYRKKTQLQKKLLHDFNCSSDFSLCHCDDTQLQIDLLQLLQAKSCLLAIITAYFKHQPQ